MSRFYDVLRHVSRSPAAAKEPLGRPRKFSQAHVREVISELSAAEEQLSAPVGTAGRRPVASTTDLEGARHSSLRQAGSSANQAENGSTISRDGFLPTVPDSVSATVEAASRAQLRLDPKARLIPNVADSGLVEYYRRLRTKILQQRETKSFRTLVVASPSPMEGKTVTTLNLALALGMLPSFRALVVDGDLRRGMIGKWLGIEKNPGLSDLIEGTANLEDVIADAADHAIHVVGRGRSKVPPAELLNSADLGRHLRRMSEDFDMVLVDSPPLNLVTDTQLIAANCDAVLLVARAFSTTRKVLEQAAQELNRFRVIGTVLNGGTKAHLYRRYAYH